VIRLGGFFRGFRNFCQFFSGRNAGFFTGDMVLLLVAAILLISLLFQPLLLTALALLGLLIWALFF